MEIVPIFRIRVENEIVVRIKNILRKSRTDVILYFIVRIIVRDEIFIANHFEDIVMVDKVIVVENGTKEERNIKNVT